MAALAGVAWVSRHPDAEIVRSARDWPVVGGLARLYHDGNIVASAPGEQGIDGDDLGVVRAIRPGPGPTRRAEPGLSLDSKPTDGEPPLGSSTAPTLPLPGRSADPEKLEQARELFFGRETVGRVGPYPLISDVTDEALLAVLDGIAAQMQESYVERHGLVPVGRAAATVVLYRSEASYRLLQSKWKRISGRPASGHTGFGMVVSYQGARPVAELAMTFIHELAHLLNRRALGPALPPWLDEGIADDLSYSRLTPSGRLIPGSLAEIRIETAKGYGLKGGLASLSILAKRPRGTGSGLPRLLDLDWHDFAGSPEIGLHYAQSSFLIRCLMADLCGEDSRESFSLFLRGISEGGPAESSALLAHLDSEWSQVEAALRVYVRGRALEMGVI